MGWIIAVAIILAVVMYACIKVGSDAEKMTHNKSEESSHE